MTHTGTISQRARATLLLVITAILLAACGGQQAINDTADQSTIRPAPITTASGQQCQPWINNPGEADGSGYRACDYPIPTDRPVRQSGMSDADYFLLGALFSYGLGHHDYYYSDNYYRNYIGPAWNRHPGSYYGYGGRQPIVRITNYSATINHVNTAYAADEKRAVADPKTSAYKSASGKTYTGKTVPQSTFKSSNVTPTGPAGSARTSNTNMSTSTTSKVPAGTSSTSKSSTSDGYSKSGTSSSSSRSGSGSSSSSSSHSSGGRR